MSVGMSHFQPLLIFPLKFFETGNLSLEQTIDRFSQIRADSFESSGRLYSGFPQREDPHTVGRNTIPEAEIISDFFEKRR